MQRKNRRIKVLAAAALLFVSGIGIVGSVAPEAASRPAKPKISLQKRTKKTAVIKIKNSNKKLAYRVYMKTSKKGKWKLHAFAMRGVPAKGKLADFKLRSGKLELRKLKPNKVYYLRLKAWRVGRKGLSSYSKTIKIGKYKSKKIVSPSPSPSSASPVPPYADVTTGDAVWVPDVTSMPVSGAEPSAMPSAHPHVAPMGIE